MKVEAVRRVVTSRVTFLLGLLLLLLGGGQRVRGEAAFHPGDGGGFGVPSMSTVQLVTRMTWWAIKSHWEGFDMGVACADRPNPLGELTLRDPDNEGAIRAAWAAMQEIGGIHFNGAVGFLPFFNWYAACQHDNVWVRENVTNS